MVTKLPPVPFKTQMNDESGLPSAAWAEWFRSLFARVGGNTDWANSQASSGYQKLSSGLYLQWGVTASIASGGSLTTTFPLAFPTTCFQVTTSIRDNSADLTTLTGGIGTGNYTKTTFDLFNRTSAAHVFNWMAVGN